MTTYTVALTLNGNGYSGCGHAHRKLERAVDCELRAYHNRGIEVRAQLNDDSGRTRDLTREEQSAADDYMETI